MLTADLLSAGRIAGEPTPNMDRVLTPGAVRFLVELQRTWGGERSGLLARRATRAAEIAAGALPGFLPETRTVRDEEWRVAPAPGNLDDRRVEITGPVD